MLIVVFKTLPQPGNVTCLLVHMANIPRILKKLHDFLYLVDNQRKVQLLCPLKYQGEKKKDNTS